METIPASLADDEAELDKYRLVSTALGRTKKVRPQERTIKKYNDAQERPESF